MRWSDVTRVHKAIGGVYVRDGKVVSILASAVSYYGDEVSRDRVRYAINPQSGKGEIAKALDSAVRDGYPFRVFFKHATGQWEDLGMFKAVGVEKTTHAMGKADILYYNLIPSR
jgi:hypothetical protein